MEKPYGFISTPLVYTLNLNFLISRLRYFLVSFIFSKRLQELINFVIHLRACIILIRKSKN